MVVRICVKENAGYRLLTWEQKALYKFGLGVEPDLGAHALLYLGSICLDAVCQASHNNFGSAIDLGAEAL